MEQRPPAGGDSSEGRRQRLDAMRALATTPPDEADARSSEVRAKRELFGRPTRPLYRRYLVAWGSIGLVLILLLAVIVAIVRGSPAAPKKGIASTSLLAIHFPAGHISCPESASWSPDGKTLAVLGYVTCSQQDNASQGIHPIVSLYDVTHGREIASFPLESALAAGMTHGKPIDGYQLRFGSPTWSVDGATIGVPVSLGATNQSDQVIYGLAIVHVAGSTAAIAADGSLALVGVTFDTYNLNTTIPPLTVRYDTANGSTAIIKPQPAFSYGWGANGSLEPATAGDAKAAPLPVGLAGSVTYVCASSGDASAKGNANYYWISAGGATWSPDGRYFFSTLGAFGRLASLPTASQSQVAVPTQHSCAIGGSPAKWATVDSPAKGLATAIRQMDPYQGNYLYFVISADGSRMAVSASTFDANGNATSQELTVYGSTGAVQKQLLAPDILKQAHVTTNQSGDVFTVLAWSGDGHSLALLDPGDRAIVILSSSQLR